MSWELSQSNCIVGMIGLRDQSVDVVITDPPYSAHVHENARARDGKEHVIGFAPLSDEVRRGAAHHFGRVARRWVLVFCEVEGAELWRADLEANGLEYIRTGFWIRTNSMPQITGDRPAAGVEAVVIAHRKGRKRWNGGGRPAVWHCPLANDTAERLHPTQKPIRLMEMLVRDFTEAGETVLDPFAGSGTTGVACIRNGRNFIGFEQEATYADLAERRLAGTREQLELVL